MISAVGAAVGDAPFAAPRLPGDCEGGAEDAEEDWRRDALERCLLEIDAQQHAAMEALRERAESYSTGVLGSSGFIDRLAVKDGERERAAERLTHLVRDTFGEVAAEARCLLGLAGEAAGLRRSLPALQRRLAFWQGQMQETWDAWETATATMHDSGQEAISAWLQLAKAVRWSRELCKRAFSPSQHCQRSMLLNALAEAAAQSLEVELLEPLGLTGLDRATAEAVAAAAGCDAADLPSGGAADADRAWPEMRFALLRSVLHQLEKAGALCDAERRLDALHAVGYGAPDILSRPRH